MGKKIIIIIFIIILCPIILCGCWNYIEIDDLAIVAGIAIDKDMITNKYIVTTEVITTQGISSNISSEIYSADGDSIFGAVRNTIEKTGLKLFWNDAKVIIISNSVAREGIIPVIDWANRSPDLRSDILMIISTGNSAAEILNTKVKLNEVVSFHLDEAMNSGRILSKFPDSKLWSFIDGLSSEGKSGIVATVKNELKDVSKSPRLVGTAVFKLDKLVGYLDGSESLYMLMIQNNIKEGLIVLKNVSGSDTNITLEISKNKTKFTPIYYNGAVSLIIDIYPVVSIGEVQGTKDFMKEETLKTLQSEAGKKIEAQIQYLISKLQKDDSDILGFEETFKKEKPKVSESFKKNGKDLFQVIKTEVNVHLQITGSGRLNNPITIGK